MGRRVGREDVFYDGFFVRHYVSYSAIDQFEMCGEYDRVRIVIYSRHLECFYGGRGTAPRHGIDLLITRRDDLPEAKHMSWWTKTAVVMLNCGSL
jgi:hypothetical protein